MPVRYAAGGNPGVGYEIHRDARGWFWRYFEELDDGTSVQDETRERFSERADAYLDAADDWSDNGSPHNSSTGKDQLTGKLRSQATRARKQDAR